MQVIRCGGVVRPFLLDYWALHHLNAFGIDGGHGGLNGSDDMTVQIRLQTINKLE